MSVSLQQIFADNWDNFVATHPVRPVVDHEVRKVIACGDINNGFSVYECEHCSACKFVPFRCHSRLCNCCGFQYQKFRAESVKRKLINCNHRHIVFTIAEELRIFFRRDRTLLNVLFQSAADTISSWLLEQNKKQKLECGMISTLHTFGRDLKWNPHIHMLVSLCATGNGIPFKPIHHIPFVMLRKRFMSTLLYNLKPAIKTKYATDLKYVTDQLYLAKDNGFYVYAYAKIAYSQDVIDYMVRYIGRPPIAKKRILKYKDGLVTFCYNRHEDDKYVEETIPVFDFIKRVIIHVPDRYFNMIRYYGLYAKPHSLRTMNKPIPRHLLRQLNLWQTRIWLSFGYNPLKCACGKFLTFSFFFFNSA